MIDSIWDLYQTDNMIYTLGLGLGLTFKPWTNDESDETYVGMVMYLTILHLQINLLLNHLIKLLIMQVSWYKLWLREIWLKKKQPRVTWSNRLRLNYAKQKDISFFERRFQIYKTWNIILDDMLNK